MQAERVYSVLLVSAAEKMNTRLASFFSGGGFEPVTVVDSVAKAQRRLLNREYDLVIVNSPLPDDFGKKLAVDVVAESGGVSLRLVKSDMYDEIASSMIPRGVMVAKRPLEDSVIDQLLNIMCSVCERLKGIRKKTMSLEDKMEEIRLVNRAKWALIKSCHMTEEDAHRFIQKQAMDLCLSKKETAENILKTDG